MISCGASQYKHHACNLFIAVYNFYIVYGTYIIVVGKNSTIVNHGPVIIYYHYYNILYG